MDVRSQVEAARRTALAVSEPELGVLVVTGADRVGWLNGMLTCDLARAVPGVATYGLAVGRGGRVLADVVVVDDAPGQRLLLAVPAAAGDALRAHLEHYLVMEDAALSPAPLEVWSVHGPASGEALAGAIAAGASGGALDRTGLGGALLLVPAARAADVRAALAAVATLGDAAGREAVRLERGVPRFGVDFDEHTYPQEAQLERAAVSFDKGCYLGQEVVCMLELRGHVKRKLAALVLDAGEPPARGAPVTDASGAAVGEVTSAAASPTLGRPVAQAMLKRAAAEAGTRVSVAGVGAEVVARPA